MTTTNTANTALVLDTCDMDAPAVYIANLAAYKCPRHVVFRDLPMTSTGKVQKFVLREWAKAV